MRTHSVGALALSSGNVLAECAACGLFAALFGGAYAGALGAAHLGAVGAALGLAHVAAGGAWRTLALLHGALWALAPVLRRLTDSFSDDTIWAASGALAALHLITFPYGNGTSYGFF